MEHQDPKNSASEEVSEEARYQYIGFEIYPKKAREFWQGEEEKKKYLEEIKRKESRSAFLERDHSLVKVVVFSKVDKVVLTMTSLFMVVSLILPWFSVKGAGPVFFFNLGKLGLTGGLFGIFFVLVALTVLASAAAGVMSLLSLYKKSADADSYLANLKKRLQLNYVPLILWVLLIIVSIVGMPTKSLDSPLGGSFNVLDLFTASSVGIWLSLPSLIINCVKISDL
ncbi:MAG: hypothetical protein WCE90_11665 [Candidatus Zixiibacteriota bacterium]